MKALFLLLYAALAAAGTTALGPRLEYHGKLADAKGGGASGTFLLHFRLWDSIQGGRQVWKESSYVRVSSGDFKALLGLQEPIPGSVLASAYRLSIETPAGTGWRTEALEPLRVFGLPETPSAVAGGPKGPLDVPDLRDSEVRDVAPSAGSGSAEPAAGEVRKLQVEVERSRAEARRAREDAELARRRVDALEQKLEKNSSEEPVSRIYVVRPGDTLRSVSLKLFGSEDRWIELYRANDDRIQRGGELIPGQLLLVPKGG